MGEQIRRISDALAHIETELTRHVEEIGLMGKFSPTDENGLAVRFKVGLALLHLRATFVEATSIGDTVLELRHFRDEATILYLLHHLQDGELVEVLKWFRERQYESTMF